MAPQIHELLALLSFFLSMILALIMVRKNLRKINSIPNIPPGPWKLPIIGNIPHLVTSMPHRKLRDLAIKYGPLMHLQLGEIFTIVVSSAECAREVMKTHDIIFASRPHLLATDILLYDSTDIAFSPYGDYWRHLRKICATELLSLKRVKSLWSIREKEITTLIKWIASKEESEINITDAVLSMLYTTFSKAAFGKKYEDKEEFISVIKKIPKLAGGFYLGDLFPSATWLQNISGMRPKLEKMHQILDRILENIVNDHTSIEMQGQELKKLWLKQREI